MGDRRKPPRPKYDASNLYRKERIYGQQGSRVKYIGETLRVMDWGYKTGEKDD